MTLSCIDSDDEETNAMNASFDPITSYTIAKMVSGERKSIDAIKSNIENSPVRRSSGSQSPSSEQIAADECSSLQLPLKRSNKLVIFYAVSLSCP